MATDPVTQIQRRVRSLCNERHMQAWPGHSNTSKPSECSECRPFLAAVRVSAGMPAELEGGQQNG